PPLLSHASTSILISTLSLHDALPICCDDRLGTGLHGFDDRAEEGRLRHFRRIEFLDVGAAGEHASTTGNHDGTHGIVGQRRLEADRKSTRLNSSHVKISYAVFCLKKK